MKPTLQNLANELIGRKAVINGECQKSKRTITITEVKIDGGRIWVCGDKTLWQPDMITDVL